MVKTHNRSALILPGGLVEMYESPADAGQPEVLEEVGLHVAIGRLCPKGIGGAFPRKSPHLDAGICLDAGLCSGSKN